MTAQEQLDLLGDEISLIVGDPAGSIGRCTTANALERDVTANIALFDDRVYAETRTTTHASVGSFRAEVQRVVQPRPRHELLDRCVNVAISFAALVAGIPLLTAIALVVRLTSRGPILYRQVRVGVDRRRGAPARSGMDQQERREYDQGGRPFTMVKFRTMRIDAEADGRAVWASATDTRTTQLGRFIRRTRLDELPQLYNVLIGDMNIVGPRPERPAIFATLRSAIADYSTRQLVKPGITGLAQISHPYDTSVNDVRRKVEYDLAYIERRGLVEDLRIMTLTLPVMLGQRKGW